MALDRFLEESESVLALDQMSLHSSAGVTTFCSCGTVDTGGALPFSFAGRIIDRLGFSRRWQTAKIVPFCSYDMNTSAASTVQTYYASLQVGLQHSLTTCSGGFVDWSTGDFSPEMALQAVTTATSTTGSYASVASARVSGTNAGLLTTSNTTSTSTGYAVLATYGSQAIPLTGAFRYIRVIVQPRIETTGCGSGLMKLAAGLVLGHPEETGTQAQAAPVGRVYVTSGCST